MQRTIYAQRAARLRVWPFLFVGGQILCLWAFSASVWLLLRLRLNGVLMALEDGGSEKVGIPVPEAKMGEK